MPTGRLAWLPTDAPGMLWRLVAAGALLRIAGLASEAHGGDMTAFMTWAEDAARHGLGSYYANGGDANYPPMLYLLWPLGVLFDGSALFFTIRLLSIPFDLALGVLLFSIARTLGRDSDGVLAAGLYLFNPAVLMSGPMWGQVDGMGALPMVAAVYAAWGRQPAAAGALAVIAGLVKPQFGIAGFVLAGLVLLWPRSAGGVRRAAILVMSAIVAFFVVLVPLGLGPVGYLGLMSDTFTRYPYLSQYGFNPWGMVFGFGDEDASWVLLGTTLAAAGIAASLWLLRRRRDLVGLLGVSVLIGLAIYFLPTRVHERYLFGAIAFLSPLAAVERRLVAPFVALSGAAFVTVAYVAVTSPYRILPGPQLAEFPDLVISAMAGVVTAIGVWTAWRVLELFRGDAETAPEALPAGSG